MNILPKFVKLTYFYVHYTLISDVPLLFPEIQAHLKNT